MNDRLRSTIRAGGFTIARFAESIEVDPKTVQRWMTTGRTPHRSAAMRAAALLNVPIGWLWPDLDEAASAAEGEVVALYPHRAQVPKIVWHELLLGAREAIDIVTNAALHLVEDNPDTVRLLTYKAANGVRVRLAMGDPSSTAVQLRGQEERMPDGIVGRVQMANSYFAPLADAPGVEYRHHGTTLYNSLYRYDDQLLVNHHAYGIYGYLAPVLHLRRSDTGDLFETYTRSFEMIWEQTYAVTDG